MEIFYIFMKSCLEINSECKKIFFKSIKLSTVTLILYSDPVWTQIIIMLSDKLRLNSIYFVSIILFLFSIIFNFLFNLNTNKSYVINPDLIKFLKKSVFNLYIVFFATLNNTFIWSLKNFSEIDNFLIISVKIFIIGVIGAISFNAIDFLINQFEARSEQNNELSLK